MKGWHERTFGSLPDTWEALREKRPDFEIPIDVETGIPLRYDTARRKIWSVGEDRLDDGGDEGTTEERAGDARDVVWKIPPLPQPSTRER